MIKKVAKILIVILVFFIFSFDTMADNNPPPLGSKKGNFSQGSFSKDNSWSRSSKKALAPPDPGDGGGGDPVPLSSGLTFLIIGSAVYLIRKIKSDIKL